VLSAAGVAFAPHKLPEVQGFGLAQSDIRRNDHGQDDRTPTLAGFKKSAEICSSCFPEISRDLVL
jgi:hypothetical protein